MLLGFVSRLHMHVEEATAFKQPRRPQAASATSSWHRLTTGDRKWRRSVMLIRTKGNDRGLVER